MMLSGEIVVLTFTEYFIFLDSARDFSVDPVFIAATQRAMILIIVIILIWVLILVGIVIIEFHFHRTKYKNDDDMIFTGVCTKQSCSQSCYNHDLQAGASLQHRSLLFIMTHFTSSCDLDMAILQFR